MEIKDIIKLRRKELNLTLKDISKACDVSEATVSRWESGDIGDIKRSRIKELCKILKLSPSVIVGVADDEQVYDELDISHIKIPLYQPICCGNGLFVDDNIVEYVPVPSKGLGKEDNYYCQIAKGDSMVNAGITDGDLLIFEKCPQVEDGMIGAFCIDDNEAVCKKFKKQSNMIVLLSMNPEYLPIVIDPLNEHFRCVGKLKMNIKRY